MVVHLDCQAQYDLRHTVQEIIGSLQLHYPRANLPYHMPVLTPKVQLQSQLFTLLDCRILTLNRLIQVRSFLTTHTIVVVFSDFLLFYFILSDGVCDDHMHVIWCVSHAICLIYLVCVI